jgi:ABC-type transport system involved in multi-copper enzyme maturation permease subunit
MLSLLRADMFKTRKRPMGWIMLGISLALVAATMTITASIPEIRDQVTPTFSYPSGLGIGLGSQGIGNLGELMMIVLGASLVGLEYRFDTWKNLMTRRPGRVPFVLSKWATMVVAVLIAAITIPLWSQGLGLLLKPASVAALPAGLGDVLLGIGVRALSLVVAGSIGMLGAVVGRSTTAGIVLGIVWTIVEQLASALLQLTERFAWISGGLFTTAQTSLQQHIDNQPAELGLLHSGLVMTAYLVIPLAIAAYIFRQRDMAG